MADSKDEANLEDLITRPMSAADLSQYRDVIDSDDFQDMIRAYHANAALNSIRQTVLGCFDYEVSVEAMLGALTNVWLDCLGETDPRLDEESKRSWRQIPQMLIQVLLLQALDTLNERSAELKPELPPEYPEMYALWRSKLPAPSEPISDEEAIRKAVEKTLRVYQTLSNYRYKLENSGLQIDGSDFLQAWSRVLLQTYLVSQGQDEAFYLIDNNWDLFLERMTAIVTLMLFLKGAEDLLLPENRPQLFNLVASDDFKQRVLDMEARS